MKSIIQKNKNRCFLCHRQVINEDELEEHHCIFGTANRKLSEKFGLKVYLCPNCHRIGKNAVHKDNETALKIKIIAQRKFEEYYPNLDFLKIFGKNYL